MITITAYRLLGDIWVSIRCHHGKDRDAMHVLSRAIHTGQGDGPVEILAAISDELAILVSDYVNSQGKEELTDECGG